MTRYPLLIFVIFLEIFYAVYCENDTFSSFNPKFNKRAELKNVDLTEDKGILFDQNEASSEAKIVGKRQLLFNDGGVNSPVAQMREHEVNEHPSRRRSNITEIQTQITEYRKGYNNWENKQNKFSFPVESGNSQNPQEFRLSQPFAGVSDQNLNWGQRSDIFETRQPQRNEEKNFHQAANAESHSRADSNFSGRVSQTPNRSNVKGNVFQGGNGDVSNKRVSVTALNDVRMLNEQNYNDEKVGEMNSGYLGTSHVDYYNRNSKGFWDANSHRPEKGVVINFNTECPTPRQYSNHMVHKFIFTPKSPIRTQHDISPFQVPETALISGQMTPMYYL